MNGRDDHTGTVSRMATSTSTTTQGVFEDRLRKKYLAVPQSLPPYDLRVIVTSDKVTATGSKMSFLPFHKELFVMASPYFSSLLSEVDAGSDGTYSVRLEMSAKDFRIVKSFLYLDDLPDQIAYNGAPIPFDITMKLKFLEISVKFEVGRLKMKIIDKIKKNMKIGDSFKLLQSSRELDLRDLETYALGIIYKNAEDLLSNHLEDFCALGSFDVIRILSSDALDCNEVTVFNASLRWANDKAKYTQEPTMKKSAIKYYFSQIATCIRFPLLSPTELAQATVREDVLEYRDLVKLFQYVCLPEAEKESISLNFESRPRRRQKTVIKRKIMPPPPPSSCNDSTSSTSTTIRKRKHSDASSVIASTVTNVTKTKRICFKGQQDSDDDSSDEDLFLTSIRRSDKSVISFEDLPRRLCSGESKPINVGSIELFNVNIKQPYRSTVYQNCKNLTIDVKLDFIKDNNRTFKEDIKSFVRHFDPMRYLVFPTKPTMKPLTAADILSLEQNILLKFNGVTFLKVSHAPGPGQTCDELVMNYIKDSCDILQSQQLRPTTLALSNCEFSFHKMKDRGRLEGIKKLILYHVWGDYTVEEIMKDCPTLSELVLWKYTPRPQTNSLNFKGSSLMTPLCMNFNHPFSANQTIRKIVLFGTELKFPTRCSNAVTSVSELHLEGCHVVPSSARGSHIEDVFHQIFPKLKRFLLKDGVNNKQGNLAKSDLINCVCSKIETIEWLRVVGLTWDWNNPNTTQASPSIPSFEESENQRLGNFLQGLKISSTSTNFLLEKKNQCWEGVDYEANQNEDTAVDGGYHSAMDKLEYEWYNLSHFFDSCQTYEDYFITQSGEGFPKPILWI